MVQIIVILCYVLLSDAVDCDKMLSYVVRMLYYATLWYECSVMLCYGKMLCYARVVRCSVMV